MNDEWNSDEATNDHAENHQGYGRKVGCIDDDSAYSNEFKVNLYVVPSELIECQVTPENGKRKRDTTREETLERDVKKMQSRNVYLEGTYNTLKKDQDHLAMALETQEKSKDTFYQYVRVERDNAVNKQEVKLLELDLNLQNENNEHNKLKRKVTKCESKRKIKRSKPPTNKMSLFHGYSDLTGNNKWMTVVKDLLHCPPSPKRSSNKSASFTSKELIILAKPQERSTQRRA
jgi:predicted RNase H-like nuclease (RuvC/YqgF family)